MDNEKKDVNNDFFTSVNGIKLKELFGVIEELLINKTRLEKISLETGSEAVGEVVNQEIAIINHVQDIIKHISAVPAQVLFSMVNQRLTQSGGGINGNVHIKTSGETTEIDSSLIKNIEEIVVYFINCFYESGVDRNNKEIDKEESGLRSMTINAFSDINSIIIKVEDDDMGIDISNRNIQSDATKINLSELNKYTFLDKYFINCFYKNTSGDIGINKVIYDINTLGGTIELKIKDEKILSVSIIIPISSSMSQAMLVTVGNCSYAMPISFIDKIIKADAVSIKRNNNHDAIIYQDRIVPLISVAQRLGVDTSEHDEKCIIIVKVRDKYAALLVDALQDQADIVVKPKPPVIRDVREFTGGAILGDGMVTLVFDIPALIDQY